MRRTAGKQASGFPGSSLTRGYLRQGKRTIAPSAWPPDVARSGNLVHEDRITFLRAKAAPPIAYLARAVLRNLGVANVDVARKESAHEGAAPSYLLREASPIGPNWHWMPRYAPIRHSVIPITLIASESWQWLFVAHALPTRRGALGCSSAETVADRLHRRRKRADAWGNWHGGRQ